MGDKVEVSVKNGEEAPIGWWLAVVRGIRHGFYFVHYLDSKKSDEIVEIFRLRSPSENMALN